MNNQESNWCVVVAIIVFIIIMTLTNPANNNGACSDDATQCQGYTPFNQNNIK